MANSGPQSVAGKVRSSRNALRHGILSSHLLLPDEDPAEYQLLLDSLFVELLPLGTLEQALVERIAVALWRQRRLVRVETARVRKSQAPGAVERYRLKERFGDQNGKLIARLLRGEGDEDDRRWQEAVEVAFQLKPLDLQNLAIQCHGVWRTLAGWAGGEEHIQAYLDKNYRSDLGNFILKLRADAANIREAWNELALNRAAMGLPDKPGVFGWRFVQGDTRIARIAALASRDHGFGWHCADRCGVGAS